MKMPKTIAEAAASAIKTLIDAKLSIATAESCTGGLVAGALTSIPGSSAVVYGGFITYSNEAKSKLIRVPARLIRDYGAVSAQVARAMADGARAAAGVDLAVAITGIAGPDGGSDKKPVGTVVFGRARKGGDPEDIVADKRHFGDLGRGGVRLQAALCALELLMPGATLAEEG